MLETVPNAHRIQDVIYKSPSDRIGQYYSPQATRLTPLTMNVQGPEKNANKISTSQNNKSKKQLGTSMSVPVFTVCPVSPSSKGRKGNNNQYMDWNPEPEDSQKEQGALLVQTPIVPSMANECITKYTRVMNMIADETYLPPLERNMEARILSFVLSSRYFKDHVFNGHQKKMLAVLLDEISAEYVKALRKSILEYDLKSEDTRNHHGLNVGLIKTLQRVDNNSHSLNNQRVSECTRVREMQARQLWLRDNLFLTEPILQKLWSVWEDRYVGYGNMILTDLSDPSFRSQLPLPFDDFQSILEAQVKDRTHKLKEAWYPGIIESMDAFIAEVEAPLKV